MNLVTEHAIERKTCAAVDGVPIVYSAAGQGEPALVFIHGGLANRGFWDGEIKAFAGRHRVIAPDLAGHGESGTKRTRWGLPEFGGDVRAVIEAEGAKSVVLFGNSLGGPVAIEAALLLASRVLGVVGVDTFQSLTYKISAEDAAETGRGLPSRLSRAASGRWSNNYFTAMPIQRSWPMRSDGWRQPRRKRPTACFCR